MPKSAGDRARRTPPTMPEMIEQLVVDVASVNDARYKRLWDYEIPNEQLRKWWASPKRTCAIIGANRALKTSTCIVKAVMIYTGIVPPSLRDVYPHKIPQHRPRHVRIIVQDYTKHWPESIKPMLLDPEFGVLPKVWADNYDPNEHIFYGPDGSWLSISAVDPAMARQPRHLRSAHIDHTMCDEITTEDAYSESLVRGTGRDDSMKTVDLALCPQEGYDWTYHQIYLSGYDKATDRKLPESQCHQDIEVLRLSMYDNPYISREDIDAFIRTLRPYQVAYRVHGLYTERGDGDLVFNPEWIDRKRKEPSVNPGTPYALIQTKIDIEDGIFKGRLQQLPDGVDDKVVSVWRVWELPQDGHKYIATMDNAEGKANSTFNVCDIWDATDPAKVSQVAQMHKRLIHAGPFAEQAMCMCTIYGECLAAWEDNNTCGGIVKDRARNYVNAYKRITTQKEIVDETDILGWHTDKWNKPAAIEEAYLMTEEWAQSSDDFCGIHSPVTMSEMAGFQERVEYNPETDKKTREFGASKGGFSDCISSLWIMAYIVRRQYFLLTEAYISATAETDDDNELSEFELKAQALASQNNSRFGHMEKAATLVALSQNSSKGGSHANKRFRYL